MPKLYLVKAIRDTRKFLKGQRLWVVFSTGAQAALVRGRYKKHGRWIESWVRWGDDLKWAALFGKPTVRWIGEVKVTDAFYAQIRGKRVDEVIAERAKRKALRERRTGANVSGNLPVRHERPTQ